MPTGNYNFFFLVLLGRWTQLQSKGKRQFEARATVLAKGQIPRYQSELCVASDKSLLLCELASLFYPPIMKRWGVGLVGRTTHLLGRD